jgi:manganese transport protein
VTPPPPPSTADALVLPAPAQASPPPPPSTADALALPAPSALEHLRARGRVRTTLTLLGPAFVAAIAYVDPGNFATNIAGGAKYGYLLLWVILAANLMAMLIQSLSAKVGIVTGKNLPELCRERFPRPVSWGLWVQAELIAMATDLAEFIGAAIALNLLFGVPLFVSGLMTGVVAFGILALQQRGYRKFELAIAGLLALILLGFLYDTLSVAHDAGGIARGFLPSFAGTDSILLATGILGATVMPHVIYLHSALTQDRIPARDDGERRSLMRFGRVDVLIAMGVAGLINMSMLIVAGSLFHGQASGIDSIEGAYNGFETYAGAGAALAFALALLASGFASSSVGTYSGQVVMQGFIARTIPLAVRRLVTMAPALVVLAIGLDPSRALIISQVVLSFGIPFALVPLVLLTSKRDLMGSLVNRRITTITASVVAAVISALNLFLLYQTFFG